MLKVADINISEDNCGLYVIKLKGTDALFFKIINNELWFILQQPDICKTFYTVIVSVEDLAGRFTPKTTTYSLNANNCGCTSTTTTTTTTASPIQVCQNVFPPYSVSSIIDYGSYFSGTVTAPITSFGSSIVSVYFSDVYGNKVDGYTYDSNFGKAALHCGVISEGETKNIFFIKLGLNTNYLIGTIDNVVYVTNSYTGIKCTFRLSEVAPITTTTTAVPILAGGNSANYNLIADWNGQNGNVTTIGSNGGPSFYGTFDQSGNVLEWNDLDGTVGSSRGLRGGTWGNSAFTLSSSIGLTFVPSNESDYIGFRLASSLNPLNLSNFVVVGDPNNSSDTTTYGGVSYTYRIGAYEVTNIEYVEFLNSVASTDTYNLYNSTFMNSNARGGISRSGSSGSFSYSVKTDMGNKPVIYVNWFDCARYCNWLHNGKPSGSQNAGATESGAYSLNGATTGNAVVKNVGANYGIPTENEWYKAAYYKGGSANAGYWLYATQSNTVPTAVTASPIGDGLIGGIPARVPDYNYP